MNADATALNSAIQRESHITLALPSRASLTRFGKLDIVNEDVLRFMRLHA